MKWYYIFIFIFSASLFSQKLEVSIDSIITDNTNNRERKFTIIYSIRNLCNEKISFFLKPEMLINNVSGSMANSPCYKLHSNDEIINTYGIFQSEKSTTVTDEMGLNLKTQKERDAAIQKYIMERVGINADSIALDDRYLWRIKRKKLLNEISFLNPNEKKTFRHELLWDKTRYHKQDDYEYYLHEVEPYYMEILITLMKEEYKDRLTSEEYQKIADDTNFIKGAFVSNKVEIDFSE